MGSTEARLLLTFVSRYSVQPFYGITAFNPAAQRHAQ